MAIKHLGNITSEIEPVNTDIKEREIAINTANKTTYTSSDGSNIIRLAIGGTAYDSGTLYHKGDIVTDDGTINGTIQTFISLTGTNNVNRPLPISGISLYWQELDTEKYNASTGGDSNKDNNYDSGQHCPESTLGEYPKTNIKPEEIGATWYIIGLGFDANGDSTEYTFTTGHLTGITVADGDTLTWVDGASGSEVWLHSRYPRIIGERAGMIWRSTETYDIGDIVTHKDPIGGCVETYISKTSPNNNNDPSKNAVAWTRIIDPDTWDSTEVYQDGDIVFWHCKTYIIPPGDGPTIPGDTPPNPPWVEVTVGKERGGVLWDTTFDYIIGDLVTVGDIIYRAKTNNNNKIPPSNPNDWENMTWGQVPLGGIIMYDGLFSKIPASFALCDGTNGTPDLRDRFVYGTITESNIGDTGGVATATMPNHSHSVTHNHPSYNTQGGGGGTSHNHSINHNHNSVNTNSVSSSHTHSINHDHAVVWSTSNSRTHTHSINHNHSSATTSSNGSHKHEINTGENAKHYNVGAADQETIEPGTYSHWGTEYMRSAGSHNHTLNLPNYSGTSGGSTSTAHSHQVDVPNYSGTSGASSSTSHTHTVDLPNYTGTSGNSASASHTHVIDLPSITVTSSSVGSGNNIPPYFKLAFIKRII